MQFIIIMVAIAFSHLPNPMLSCAVRSESVPRQDGAAERGGRGIRLVEPRRWPSSDGRAEAAGNGRLHGQVTALPRAPCQPAERPDMGRHQRAESVRIRALSAELQSRNDERSHLVTIERHYGDLLVLNSFLV